MNEKTVENAMQIIMHAGDARNCCQEALEESGRIFTKRWGIDFYHTYKEDLKLLAELGLKTYRTSINWSRIYPNGDDAEPNEELLYILYKNGDKGEF